MRRKLSRGEAIHEGNVDERALSSRRREILVKESPFSKWQASRHAIRARFFATIIRLVHHLCDGVSWLIWCLRLRSNWKKIQYIVKNKDAVKSIFSNCMGHVAYWLCESYDTLGLFLFFFSVKPKPKLFHLGNNVTNNQNWKTDTCNQSLAQVAQVKIGSSQFGQVWLDKNVWISIIRTMSHSGDKGSNP